MPNIVLKRTHYKFSRRDGSNCAQNSIDSAKHLIFPKKQIMLASFNPLHKTLDPNFLFPQTGNKKLAKESFSYFALPASLAAKMNSDSELPYRVCGES